MNFITEIFSNSMVWWLFGTAIVFTMVGYIWGLRAQMIKVVGGIIDGLINDGYLKTRGTGTDMEIIKWRDWENDKTN